MKEEKDEEGESQGEEMLGKEENGIERKEKCRSILLLYPFCYIFTLLSKE